MLYFIRDDLQSGFMWVEDLWKGREIKVKVLPGDLYKGIEFHDESHVLDKYPKFFCNAEDFKVVMGKVAYNKVKYHMSQAEYAEKDAADAIKKLDDKDLEKSFKQKADKHKKRAAELKKTPEYKAFVKQQAVI